MYIYIQIIYIHQHISGYSYIYIYIFLIHMFIYIYSLLCSEVSTKTAGDVKASGGKQQTWDGNWQDIYALSGVVYRD